ncbi:hypothetical protein PR003_g16344 [Phytophthora rubi]|uniref:REJ domain-containing protein n=1 Tax=Phytophthora rubi TaxID=129364 RepID=A0A6A3K485_9STRA|nr:hypothetical protein PR002_g22554 [Phytophthora rubi]KAE8999104.1 hypothetical protein PR001_g19143 [Phytophthora rubi]KAE9325958.1 hypothetical protein PR003_g16344 [Phytophthora rubi]
MPRTRGSSARASGGDNSGHESDSADANSDTDSNCSTNRPPDEDQSHLLSSDDSSSNSSRDSDITSSSSSDCSSSSDSGREKKRKRSSKKKKKSSKRNHDRRSAQHNSNLEVPKLTGADDYELWRTMIELKLKVQSSGR